MTTEQPAIEVHGLAKAFGSNQVLKGIDLRVAAGTIIGFVGPNGAGKSTTVKILCGWIDNFEGEARVLGLDLRSVGASIRERVGYVAESAVLYDDLTAFEFLQLVGHLRKIEPTLLEHRIEGWLEVFELNHRAHERLVGFSKGMRQKVMIIAGLLHDPEVLFLDEPLGGLDVSSAYFMKELLRAMAARGRTVFYCSHIMDVVERVCDQILVLDQGKIVAQGTYDELARESHAGTLEEVFRKVVQENAFEPRLERALELLGDG